MSKEDLNLNTGSEIVNFSDQNALEDQFTVVVSGLGRSGTSMIAKLLVAGGISMGSSSGPIQEDVGISTLIEQARKWALRREVKRRNNLMDVWGFKRPLIVKHHKTLDRTLRNPRYILIFRDPFAVTSRNKLSLGFTISQGLEIFRKQSEILENFIRDTKRPILLLSYEKVLGDPDEAVSTIQNYCGIDKSKTPAMLAQIRANDSEYRKKTTLK